jgi:hypothetical protein
MGFPQWFPAPGQSLEELIEARRGLVARAKEGKGAELSPTPLPFRAICLDGSYRSGGSGFDRQPIETE